MTVYDSPVTKWTIFCNKNNLNFKHVSVKYVAQFLQTLVDQKLSYSTVNTARSALSSFVKLTEGGTVGHNEYLTLLLQGAFNLNPPRSRHSVTWDPEVVLAVFRKGQLPEELPTEQVAKRLALIILLLSAQRPQILRALRLSNMVMNESHVMFHLKVTDFKQGRPGYAPPIMLLKAFPEERVCVKKYMQVYLDRTRPVRNGIDELFITSRKPYRVATRDTLARWVKDILKFCGVDTDVFGAGSVRAAATSKAQQCGVSLSDIMGAAGWTQASTFARFYDKPVCGNDFATAILNSKC